ncbi:MAG: hypothetical protein COB38_11005 [Gammaproteobacteria bacterium]|nr:MAG: hypothetical protein COB38_11005 [Gammaproteobacteria bacterium]
MDYQNYVNHLDKDTINKLKLAVEIGKWDNGDRLSQKQIESAMQAIMLWQSSNQIDSENEPFKVNSKGEFSIGKGTKLNDIPVEHKSINDDNDKRTLIFSAKIN